MESKQEPIPIVSLPLPRLMEFSKEIESRCEQLADAIGQLQGAMARYDDIRMALDTMVPSNQGKEVMVPFTDSLYVPGTLTSCEKVIVDIGVGYYVEKPIADAKQFVERKLNLVKKNVMELETQLDVQTRNLEQITLVIEQKKQTASKR